MLCLAAGVTRPEFTQDCKTIATGISLYKQTHNSTLLFQAEGVEDGMSCLSVFCNNLPIFYRCCTQSCRDVAIHSSCLCTSQFTPWMSHLVITVPTQRDKRLPVKKMKKHNNGMSEKKKKKKTLLLVGLQFRNPEPSYCEVQILSDAAQHYSKLHS